ncbi:MAG: hypothetical protein K0R17_309 [Rariglobus sp.]|jgi:hypothetical protein|nr:hypothetical protein [Rariglobus sp.]
MIANIMNRTLSLRVALMLGFASCASALELGQTLADVEAELGEPAGKLVSAQRSIYRWPDVEVTLDEGRVSRIVYRDRVGEAATGERRRRSLEAAQKIRDDAMRVADEREAERVAQEERERPERERRAQAEKIAALEAALESQRAALQAELAQVAQQRSEERAARLRSLGKELSSLRLEIEHARTDGDSERVTRLRGVLLAKAQEFKRVERQAP